MRTPGEDHFDTPSSIDLDPIVVYGLGRPVKNDAVSSSFACLPQEQ